MQSWGTTHPVKLSALYSILNSSCPHSKTEIVLVAWRAQSLSESCICNTDLEVSVTEPEQQPAIDAVVHELLAVLAQAYVVRPVTHLSHSPMVHIVLHGLLHCCLQPGPGSLQSHTHAAFIKAKTHMLLSQQQKHTCCFHDSKQYLSRLQQVTAHLRHESSDRFAAVARARYRVYS